MGWVRRGLNSLPRFYTGFAVIFCNCVLLLVIINLLAQAGLEIDSYFKKTAKPNGAPWSFRRFNDALTPLYPGFTKEQISTLITETRHLRQEYEPFTQFRESPCKGEFVNFDAKGYRPIKDQPPWPPPHDKPCIFVFGGSTTFGYGVSDGLTVPSRLQDLLRSEHGISANVYNFGRGSYFSVQERILFERLLLAGFVPDIAIFIDGLNDLTVYDGQPARTQDLRAFMDEGEQSLFREVIKELPLAKALKVITHTEDSGRVNIQARFQAASPSEQTRLLQGVVDRYFANMRITEALAKDYGVIPVFVWQPVPVFRYDGQYSVFGRFDYEGKLPTVRSGYELMAQEFANKQPGRNAIWAADIQQNLKKPLYVDAVHYSPEMTEILARFILDEMVSRGLYKESQTRGRQSPGEKRRSFDQHS